MSYAKDFALRLKRFPRTSRSFWWKIAVALVHGVSSVNWRGTISEYSVSSSAGTSASIMELPRGSIIRGGIGSSLWIATYRIDLKRFLLDEFLGRVAGKGPGRCEQCYRMRLDSAATEAKQSGNGLFTTSLLYRKYQKHDRIAGVAKEMAREHGVELYYEDFRKGWSAGVKGSNSMGLYRQQYCGCVYSEKERYRSTLVTQEPNSSQNGRNTNPLEPRVPTSS